MEQKIKKLDLKTVMICILALLVIILIIVVIISNKDNEKYVTLDISNYSDYLTITTNNVYYDNNNKRKVAIASKGLSSNYNYENIEITAIVTFTAKYKGETTQSEEITLKCKVDGSSFGKLNLEIPEVWNNNPVTYTIKNVKGKLTLAK